MVDVQPPNPGYVGPLPHHGAEDNKPIRVIVIHCTAGEEPAPGAARRTVAWTKSHPEAVSSYHYCADSHESVQAVWDSVVAYHCGHNANSIGYELCCKLDNNGEGHWRQDDHQKMMDIAAEDVARLCLAYGVPIHKLSVAELRDGKEGLCGHVDIRDAFPGSTTHWDPGPFFPWPDFIRRVQAAADRLTTPPVVHTPHDPFVFALLPGKWSAPLATWKRRHKEASAAGATIIPMTEATRDDKIADFQAWLGTQGWGSYRDSQPGPSNILHTWDTSRWELVGTPWKVKLTDIDYWSAGGFHQPLPYSVGIALKDKTTGRVVLVVSAHLPLENTPRRVRAKEESIATVKDRGFDVGRGQFPKGARVLACDFNRPSQGAATRAWFETLWPHLRAAWPTATDPGHSGPDWVAAGEGHLKLGDHRVLRRAKGDPFDHTTKVVTLSWLR